MSKQFYQPLSDEETLDLISKSRSKLRYVLPALVLKLKYRLWLAVLRDVSILNTLILHYDKIPKDSRTYRLVTLLKKHSFLRNLICKVEKKLRKKIY